MLAQGNVGRPLCGECHKMGDNMVAGKRALSQLEAGTFHELFLTVIELIVVVKII